MSAVHELAVALEESDVLRLLGYPPGRRPPAPTAARLDVVLDEARHLVRARGAWQELDPRACGELQLDRIPADGLVIGLATVGAELEGRASQCLQAGDSLGALLFDAAGSAAAEEAADRLGALVVAELAGQEARDSLLPAARLSCRISPGYGRWHLPAQRPLFARLPHAELGVTLTPSLLMSPRKSVSFALWLGADRRPLAGLSGCARCELEECRYRRAG